VGVLAGAVLNSAPAQAEAADVDTVVVLGDSYSSGVGIHSDASDYDDHGPREHSFDPDTRLGHSACHRETDTTFGPQLADALDADMTFVACAGAVVEEIPNQVAAAGIDGTGEGTVVTVTIGGNDLRTERGEDWPDVLLRCVLETDCHESEQNQVANLSEIQGDLIEVYQAIGEEFPDITVRILGYPRIMQPDRWGCIGMTGVGSDEANWVDDQVDALNLRANIAAILARMRTGADIRYVSVVDEFDNHGACRVWQRDRYVNDTRIGETYRREMNEQGEIVDVYRDGWRHLSSSSVHPSQAGYDAYFDALVTNLDLD
jgi:lysophospholipase L1-like esterase